MPQAEQQLNSHRASAVVRPASSPASCCGHSCCSQSTTTALRAAIPGAPCRRPLSCSSPSSCGKLKSSGLCLESTQTGTQAIAGFECSKRLKHMPALWHCAPLPCRRFQMSARSWAAAASARVAHPPSWYCLLSMLVPVRHGRTALRVLNTPTNAGLSCCCAAAPRRGPSAAAAGAPPPQPPCRQSGWLLPPLPPAAWSPMRLPGVRAGSGARALELPQQEWPVQGWGQCWSCKVDERTRVGTLSIKLGAAPPGGARDWSSTIGSWMHPRCAC